MRRRALLASLAAGATSLAGCSFLGDASSGDRGDSPESDLRTGVGTITAAPVPNSTRDLATDPRTGGRLPAPDSTASVVELETVSRTCAFAPTTIYTDSRAEAVLWFDRTATADHPARLVGWIENAADSTGTVRLDRIPAVGRVHARRPDDADDADGGATLHLAPTDEHALAETVPEVSRTDGGRWAVDSVGDWTTPAVRLAPRERRRLSSVVVAGPDSSGLPTGVYEFPGDNGNARATVWDTASPGPEAESQFAGQSVPTPGLGDSDGDGRSIQWYHEADRTTPVFVRPTTERLELDGEVRFTAINHSREHLRCGHWSLYKLVDEEWFFLGPHVRIPECRSLAPGERDTWALLAFNGAPSARESRFVGIKRPYLGGGRYGVVTGFGHPADASAALVELVGPPVEIEPTEGTTAERDGDVVTVTSDRHGDDEHPDDASFTLERADGAAKFAVERLIAEQVMGEQRLGPPGGLRNALPFLDQDVERVVVRTDERIRERVLGEDGSERQFRLRGATYTAASVDDGNAE